LGMFWSLAEPLAFMGILYVVFGIGLRGGRNMEIPFICYLVTGLAATQFFTQTMAKSTAAVGSNSFLLQQVNVRLGIVPLITVLSGIVNHFLFFIAVCAILFLHRIFPNLYWFQLLYYLFALSMFLLGIGWFVSAVGVFFPDLRNIVSLLGRIIFYFSPVIWDYNLIPEKLQFWVKLNPMFYIVMGYRESLFYSIPFWEHLYQTYYFWGWTLVMWVLGIITFRRLRPHIADFV
jgi:ABC-type polysaccharide/polyol phosphate export permease